VKKFLILLLPVTTSLAIAQDEPKTDLEYASHSPVFEQTLTTKTINTVAFTINISQVTVQVTKLIVEGNTVQAAAVLLSVVRESVAAFLQVLETVASQVSNQQLSYVLADPAFLLELQGILTDVSEAAVVDASLFVLEKLNSMIENDPFLPASITEKIISFATFAVNNLVIQNKNANIALVDGVFVVFIDGSPNKILTDSVNIILENIEYSLKDSSGDIFQLFSIYLENQEWSKLEELAVALSILSFDSNAFSVYIERLFPDYTQAHISLIAGSFNSGSAIGLALKRGDTETANKLIAQLKERIEIWKKYNPEDSAK
jgi:hypothetical protein